MRGASDVKFYASGRVAHVTFHAYAEKRGPILVSVMMMQINAGEPYPRLYDINHSARRPEVAAINVKWKAGFFSK